MKYTLVVAFFVICTKPVVAQSNGTPNSRMVWLKYMDKVAAPVLKALASDNLKKTMPVELSTHIDNAASRSKVAWLEAFGRVMAGIGPWVNGSDGTAEEQAMRQQYRDWSLKALRNAVDPKAADYLQWEGGQPLVDASFLALGLVRCPWLWEHSDSTVQRNLINAFISTRSTVPGFNNWILFSGMIETFFCKYHLPFDALRIDYGVRQFMQHWYVGDGLFSDGTQYHNDYYNSYVIQPYLAGILQVTKQSPGNWDRYADRLDKINKRYAVIQERWINADGSFPVTGRSIVYRGGAFHHLADMALRKALPESLPPAQVRAALEAVIKKTLDAPGTFNKEGWLNHGLSGRQPDLSDVYITTGSLYLCSLIFLPLGLPASDDFWTRPSLPWTSVKVWSGQDFPADHALDIPLN
jgi:hypothetical protein